MKKMLLLTMAMVLVGLFLGSVALAQTTVMNGTTMISYPPLGPPPTTSNLIAVDPTGPLPPSGGPWIVLPAAALLLGTGVLTYTILRRDR